jgi:hypothetical protein
LSKNRLDFLQVCYVDRFDSCLQPSNMLVRG